MTDYSIWLLPVLAAAIGWLTNWVAIRMLFHPRRSMNFVFFRWQGLIPRRQKEMAAEISLIIEREILQQHMLADRVRELDFGAVMAEAVERLIKERMGPQLKNMPVVGALIQDSTLDMLSKLAIKELDNEGHTVLEGLAEKLEASFQIREIVEERVAAFDLDKLEELVMQVAGREFRTIERLGAILGFVIGLIQILILYLSGTLIL